MQSRAKDIILNDYEKILGKSFIETPMGVKHKSIMQDTMLKCLIPYFDLINNYTPKIGKESSLHNYLLNFNPLGVKVLFEKSFKKGGEYTYSYLTKSINNILLMKYGFYLPSDEYDVKVALPFKIRKDIFTELKWRICKKIKCLEHDLDNFYLNKKSKEVDLYIEFSSDKINENFLSFLRLLSLPNKFLESLEIDSHVQKKLKNGKWLNYENEIASLARYIEIFDDALASCDLKLVSLYLIV